MEGLMTWITLCYYIRTVISNSIIRIFAVLCRVFLAFEMPELYAGKLARTVLWGRGVSNDSLLPDTDRMPVLLLLPVAYAIHEYLS